MSEKETGFLNPIWTCMRSPRKGFESIDEKDLVKGVLIILLVASLSAFAGFSYASRTPLTIIPESFRNYFVIFFTIRNSIRPITGWLATAVILHIFASILMGKGSLKRLLTLTGFASTPQIIKHILRIIDAYTLSIDSLVDLIPVRALTETIPQRFLSQLLNTFNIFGLWVFTLTIIAVSINYKSSKSRALTATIASYFLFILAGTLLPY